MLRFLFGYSRFNSVLLLLLLLCNAFILHAQPKFINEAQGISGYNFSDVASFFLLLALAECFISLGGFLGAMFFTMLLSIAFIDAFYIALPLKIVFDNVLLAFTDVTSLSGYKQEFLLLMTISVMGGLLLRHSLRTNFKAFTGWLYFFTLLGMLSLFSGSHSALDKRDFLPFFGKVSLSQEEKKLSNDNNVFLEKEFPHKLRESWGGLMGDLGFIIAHFFMSSPQHFYSQKASLSEELDATPPLHSELKTILLIMGESSNPSHYGIYDSKNETTPFLIKLEKEKLACHLSQAHSAANLTRNGVLPSVSFWRPEKLSSIAETQNILELAKNSGFQTYWLSKQIENNAYTAPIGYVVQSASNFISPKEIHGIYHYKEAHTLSGSDFTLLPLLQKALSNPSPQKFIGLHIEGSHMPYPSRSEETDKTLLPNASWYDLSIHTTDRFLEKTYLEALKFDPNMLIFYVSDHGEDLENGGHAIAFGHLQYEIPLIFIGKNALQWCNKAEKLRQKNGWYSSLSNNLLISQMLGFEIKPEAIQERLKKDIVLLPNGKAGIWEEIAEKL